MDTLPGAIASDLPDLLRVKGHDHGSAGVSFISRDETARRTVLAFIPSRQR
jgi:hypothetical protein